MNKTQLLKVVCFCIIFTFLFGAVSKILTSTGDYRNYQWITGFYEEEDNSLDAVYIGSSTCYAFWNSLVGWNEYGIAIYPYASNDQPFEATEYLIKETRKTQSDAVFIVNIKMIEDDGTISTDRMHYLLDYIPSSITKLQLTNYLVEKANYSFSESLEFYLPVIRFHTRWSELTPKDFDYEVDGLKGASFYSTYLNDHEDLSSQYIVTDETNEIAESTIETLDSLLDYCEEEDINILFVTVPQVRKTEEEIKNINALAEYISARGFDVLSLLNEADEVGLDLTQDFYNYMHANIHGSIKYTHFLAKYLIENYGFEDKRGQEEYSDWDEGYTSYAAKISRSVLDIELDQEHRDYNLSAPTSLAVSSLDGDAKITWDGVDGAEGYAIYRNTTTWELVDYVYETSYIDETYEAGTSSSYRVVPFYETDGENYYGNFTYAGVSLSD